MISKTGRALKKALFEIADDKHFVTSVMVHARTEENWKIILDFIESKEDNSVERLLLFSLALGETVE